MFIELTDTENKLPVLINVHQIECIFEFEDITEIHLINSDEYIEVTQKVNDIRCMIQACQRT
jgi:uncharacterized protein YlzI (FlbEa/FlbD family)